MKKYLLFTCLIVVALVACEKKPKQITTHKPKTRTREISQEERDLIRIDSINRHLEGIADRIWSYEKRQNMGEALSQQFNWQKQCRKELLLTFDSIYPNTQLTEAEKVDSLLAELKNYIDSQDNEDNSTMEFGMNNSYRQGYLMYQIIRVEQEILAVKGSFRQEFEAWNRFQKPHQSYLMGLVYANYWGGTIAAPICGFVVNYQLQSRQEDLQRILLFLQEKAKDEKASNWESTLSKFTETAETRFQEVITFREEMVKEEYYGIEQYDENSQEIQQDMKSMNQELSKWVKIRKTLPCPNSAIKMMDELIDNMLTIGEK